MPPSGRLDEPRPFVPHATHQKWSRTYEKIQRHPNLELLLAKLRFDCRDGLACGFRHAEAAADQCRKRMTLVRIQVEIGTPQQCQLAASLGAQIDAEQPSTLSHSK
jgi:hypothetical protein